MGTATSWGRRHPFLWLALCLGGGLVIGFVILPHFGLWGFVAFFVVATAWVLYQLWDVNGMLKGRYELTIVGQESGGELPVTFLRFRRFSDAVEQCRKLNDGNDGGLTRWEVRDRHRVDA